MKPLTETGRDALLEVKSGLSEVLPVWTVLPEKRGTNATLADYTNRSELYGPLHPDEKALDAEILLTIRRETDPVSVSKETESPDTGRPWASTKRQMKVT